MKKEKRVVDVVYSDGLHLDNQTLAYITLGKGFGRIAHGFATSCDEYGGVAVMVDWGATPGREDRDGAQGPNLNGFIFDVDMNGRSYKVDFREMLEAVCLTHGHLDHVLGLRSQEPWDLTSIRRRWLPVVGTPFTIEIAKQILDGSGLERWYSFGPRPKTYWLQEMFGQSGRLGISLDPFEVHYFGGSQHQSIEDADHIAISAPAGTVVVTPDFNWETRDHLERFVAWIASFDNLRAIVCDSTSLLNETPEPDDSVIEENLYYIIKDAPSATVILTFSTNITRWQTAVNAAVRAGKKYLAVAGRSARNMIYLALKFEKMDLGGLELIDLEKISQYDPSETVIFATGCQLEEYSALWLYLYGDDHRIGIPNWENLTFVFASSVIPNEENIAQVTTGVADLVRKLYGYSDAFNGRPKVFVADPILSVIRGVEIVPVHRSGHAGPRETEEFLLELKQAVHARFGEKAKLPDLIWSHGSINHQQAGVRLSTEVGWQPDLVHAPQDGDVFLFNSHGVEVVSNLPADLPYEIKATRRKKGAKPKLAGRLSVIAVVDEDSGGLLSHPQIEYQPSKSSSGNEVLDEDTLRKIRDLATMVLSHRPILNVKNTGRRKKDLFGSILGYFDVNGILTRPFLQVHIAPITPTTNVRGLVIVAQAYDRDAWAPIGEPYVWVLTDQDIGGIQALADDVKLRMKFKSLVRSISEIAFTGRSESQLGKIRGGVGKQLVQFLIEEGIDPPPLYVVYAPSEHFDYLQQRLLLQ